MINFSMSLSTRARVVWLCLLTTGIELPATARLPDVVWSTNGHASAVNSVAFSPDGTLLATAGGAAPMQDVQHVLWTVNAHTSSVNALKFSIDDNLLISGGGVKNSNQGGDASVKLWNAHNGMALRTLTGHIHAVLTLAVSPDGRFLASGGRRGNIRPSAIKIWSLPNGELADDIFSDEDPGFDPVANAAALDFSPDSALLAACDESTYGTVPIW